MLETGKQRLNVDQSYVVGLGGKIKGKRASEEIRNGESRFEEKHGRRQ